MTRRLDFSLSAAKLFPLFIGFYIQFLILYILQILGSLRAQEAAAQPGSFLLTLAALLGLLLLYMFFTIPFLRRILPALWLQDRPLAFRGSIGRFVGLNLLGAFLSLITLGIYLPWYLTRVSRYLVGETSFEGRTGEFTGRGGRLFVILLLSLVLPITVVSALIGLFAARSGVYEPGTLLWVYLLILILLMLLLPACIYEIYRWFFTGLRLEPLSVGWRTRFWPAVGTILLQTLLGLVTAGIYLPAAYVKLYRYFAERTVLERDGEPYGRFGFDGKAGAGFLRIWGQSLLIIITIGFYYPWAMARIGRWFAECTFLDTPSP